MKIGEVSDLAGAWPPQTPLIFISVEVVRFSLYKAIKEPFIFL
jgi:hypothetical protein